MSKRPLVYGFVKVRNEVLREGNIYRLLGQLESLCDGGVICDDASTDGTREIVDEWMCAVRDRNPGRGNWWPAHTEVVDFSHEMYVKQDMLRVMHTLKPTPDWILWMDGDELFDNKGLNEFRAWIEAPDCAADADVWAFHYTQLWRGLEWARTDDGFDNGWFWKLWRYSPDLEFHLADRLHSYQFPKNFYEPIMQAVDRHGGSHRRAQRAPFEILHLGNVGKNLVWKAIQYRNSGPLAAASLKRHLYFGANAKYRHVPAAILPMSVYPAMCMENFGHWSREADMNFTVQEQKIIERMGDLKRREGLCVVIVPTYDRAHRLAETIASVRAQTYENWVCVVLDDGSTDDTQGVARELQDLDPRIFYCRYPENRGGVAMNEIGCALACEFGEFWVRLGSDDYFKPHKLALDVAAMREFPNASACYGPYRDLHGKTEGHLNGLPSDARGALLEGRFAVSWANVCVRTSALREVREIHGNFVEPDIRNMEDFLLNVRLATRGEFVWRAQAKHMSGRGASVQQKFYAAILNGPAAVLRLVQEEIGSIDDLDHDAIWRIAEDGASQKHKICNDDEAKTRKHIEAMKVSSSVRPREETTIVVRSAP